VKTLTELHHIGITHGDICEQNVAMNNSNEDCELVFFDFGELAPRYEGDVKATGKLLLWCVEHFTWSKSESEVIGNAAGALSREDVQLCLQILERE
jgi:RIO-like serine/threonine protein kinase